MSQVNPDDFIITRKRKKYKFAKFSNAENCFEADEWKLGSADVVEVGAGDGLFLLEHSAKHPTKTFLAIDVKADRLQKGAYQALERGLENIYFVRARADQINNLLPVKSLNEIWLTFSDPFPRKGSSGRRLTHANFLRKYARLLRPGGFINLKHDNPDFFQWSLEQLVKEKWHIDELSFDLHDSELHEDYKIMTTYEQRWIKAGLKTNFVRAKIL